MTSNLPEPNFIERNPEKIINEWIALYEEKSGKSLQPAQIERLMIDVGAYRESILRVAIQETAKQNLLPCGMNQNLMIAFGRLAKKEQYGFLYITYK